MNSILVVLLLFAQGVKTNGLGKHPVPLDTPITNWVYVADCPEKYAMKATAGFTEHRLWIISIVSPAIEGMLIAVREEDVPDAQVVLRSYARKHPRRVHVIPGKGYKAHLNFMLSGKRALPR
jgi:hypothetical protein